MSSSSLPAARRSTVRSALRSISMVVALTAVLGAACGTIDGSLTDPGTDRPVGDAPTLVGGGSSFGECGGYCVSELTIDGALVTLTQSTWDDQPDRVISGVLTEDGIRAVADAEADVIGVALEEVYGCPDCTDGGAEWVMLTPALTSAGGPAERTTFDFGAPPPEINRAALLVRAVIKALADCTDTDQVTVEDDCTLPS